jgi:ubiquitin carboxyl-terminal hydrolase L3
MAVWLPLESSPEVMSRYLKKLGVEGVEVCDIYSLEEDALFLIPEPVYGIILLFPMTEKYKKLGAGKEASLEKPDKLVFFVKQTILNACGSLALTHVILNNYDKIKFSGYFSCVCRLTFYGDLFRVWRYGKVLSHNSSLGPERQS